jgi:hypothetical protein
MAKPVAVAVAAAVLQKEQEVRFAQLEGIPIDKVDFKAVALDLARNSWRYIEVPTKYSEYVIKFTNSNRSHHLHCKKSEDGYVEGWTKQKAPNTKSRNDVFFLNPEAPENWSEWIIIATIVEKVVARIGNAEKGEDLFTRTQTHYSYQISAANIDNLIVQPLGVEDESKENSNKGAPGGPQVNSKKTSS